MTTINIRDLTQSGLVATGFTGSTGASGYVGSKGDTGSQGATGFTGSVGPQGIQGTTGFTGSTGDTGGLGYTGSIGYSGSAGPQGTIGFTGSTGAAGTNGSTGFTGSAGTNGTNGSDGAQGFTGSQGIKGDTGFTGSTGSQGLAGFTGSTGVGFTGSSGANGTNGFTGSAGTNGSTGFTGSTGANGNDGATGATGFTGSQGIQGVSGFTGSVGSTGATGFTGSMGAQGTTGFTGSMGANGNDGATGFTGSTGVGYTGSSGSNGTNGFTGSAGSNGATGFTGSAGTNGTNGTDGSVGFTGSTGSNGATGFTGSSGSNGATGFTGSIGAQGDIGYTGSIGSQGIIGYTGSTGVGYTGSSGTNGTNGADGAQGYTGSAGSGTAATWTHITTPTTLSTGTNYLVDTSTGTYAVTLPASPSVGDYVKIADGANWNTHSLTVQRNGNLISGVADDILIDINEIDIEFIYTGSTEGWAVITSVGATGAQGYTGSKGTTGYTGSTGAGYTGSHGDIGYTGSVGAQGDIGYTGSQGIQGDVGYIGSQGIQGDLGYIGSQGIQGVIGYTGSIGSQGTTGFTGSVGSQGTTGFTGSTGVGYTGSAGVGTTITVTAPSPSFANYLAFTTSTGGTISTVNVDTMLNYDDSNHRLNLESAMFSGVAYFGTSSTTTSLSSPVMIGKSSSSTYIQAALFNGSGTGSADWIAYGNTGTDATNWMDMGFTGDAFNDSNYTITGPNEGYIFSLGSTAAGTGNMVIATGSKGTTKDIVFATGGFLVTDEVLRLVDATHQLKFRDIGASVAIVANTATNTFTNTVSDSIAIFAKSTANRVNLAIATTGTNAGYTVFGERAFQTALATGNFGYWTAAGGVLSSVVGMGAMTAVGTATAIAPAATNLRTRAKRIQYVSAGTAGSLSGIYSPAATGNIYTVGSASNAGGFYFVTRFAPIDTVAARMFIGLSSNTAAPTNVEPSTLVNSIGIGMGTADTNMSIYYGGSAAQTPVALGANFPAKAGGADYYEFTMYAPRHNSNVVYYRVHNLTTGAIVEGSVTAASSGTQLPAASTFMSPRAWRCNNATAAAVTLELASIYIEADV